MKNESGLTYLEVCNNQTSEFGGEKMSIIKHEIPILEFDTEQTAVINPTHEKLNILLPRKCVFAFLGEYIDKYASLSDTYKVSEFISATKLYPIYITKSMLLPLVLLS